MNRVAIKNLKLTNFKCYENYSLEFGSDNEVYLLFGLLGPNGCGKTTILDAINMCFASYDEYEKSRLEINMSKHIRNYKNLTPQEKANSNFLIEADIMSDIVDYSIKINKSGYLEGFDHPLEIKKNIVNQCFRTRYDEELNNFQLKMERWDQFKNLFEIVTGYEVNKDDSQFSVILHDGKKLNYVNNLIITKEYETITDRECSKGEKKIIKNFTTLLNKDIKPSIIVIDDVEMHVELDRHLMLLECIEKCFENSQVIFTTHSPKIICEFDLDRLTDLTVKNTISNDYWRKYYLRILNKLSFLSNDEKLKVLSYKIRNDNKLLENDIKKEIYSMITYKFNKLKEEVEL